MGKRSDTEAVAPEPIALSPKSISGSIFQRWMAKLSSSVERQELSSSPFLPLFAGIFFYVFLAVARSMRPLWHDELYTYYIALSPTLAQFIGALTKLDLNPPLAYALARLSLNLLGDSTIACRAPFILAFLIGSLGLYRFVRNKLGRFYGLTAMLVLWCSPFFQYATEARPYALLLAFFGVALLGCQAATETGRRKRRLGIVLMCFGVWGMLMSHCFGLITVGVIALAELIRSADRRKLDWPIWVGLPCRLRF